MENCLKSDAIHDFWYMRIDSNPADINRFQSYTGNNFIYFNCCSELFGRTTAASQYFLQLAGIVNKSCKLSVEMDIWYTWIYWQAKNCRQFRLLLWSSFIGSFIHSSSSRRGHVCGFLSCYKFHFIRVHENLVQHPSNTISITVAQLNVHLPDLVVLAATCTIMYQRGGRCLF